MWYALRGFLAGPTYPFRVLGLLQRQPSLWGYIAVPIVVNILAGIALYVGLLLPGLRGIDDLAAYLSSRLETFVTTLPKWLEFLTAIATVLDYFLSGLLIVALLLLTGFLLVQVGSILGSPWYGQLSEQIEKSRIGKLPAPEGGVAAIFRDIWRAILFEVKKILLAIGVGLVLFALNFLPGAGTVASSVGGIALAANIVCLDFLDASLERRRFRFREKLGIVWQHFPATGSFSLVCLGLISIPFVNLLTVPICVASGTLFFCDRIYPKLD